MSEVDSWVQKEFQNHTFLRSDDRKELVLRGNSSSSRDYRRFNKKIEGNVALTATKRGLSENSAKIKWKTQRTMWNPTKQVITTKSWARFRGFLSDK